jgi:YD repeat-containing protein
MKQYYNIFKILKKSTILIFSICFANYLNGQTYPCDMGTNSAFTYEVGSCNNGLSVQLHPNPIVGIGVKHTWVVNNAISNDDAPCMDVPASGTYSIVHSVLIGGTNYTSTCSIYIPQAYLPNVLPSTNINKSINTSAPVGAIKGSNSVSLSGGANYSIPIALPTGTAGIEPSLSLDYNSQGGGSGILGYSWGLSATSAISVTRKDLYNDVYVGPVNKTNLVLDGNRLVYNSSLQVYETKNETFSKITPVPDVRIKDYFLVETKDGMKLEYGNATNSRIKGLLWQLNKKEDQYGNYIEYTGNSKANIKPYNSIKFSYAPKFDKNISYIIDKAAPVSSNSILTNIVITAEGGLYRKYDFLYVSDKVHTFLREVKVADGDGKYLNSTLFQYGNVETEFINSIVGNLPQTPTSLTTTATGDFNGDGLSDVLIGDFKNTKNKEYESFTAYTRNNGSNTFTKNNTVILKAESDFIYEINSGTTDQINFLAQDFNGDGFDDVPFVSMFTIKQTIVSYIDRDPEGNPIDPPIPVYAPGGGLRYVESIDIHHSKGDGNFNNPISYNTKVPYQHINQNKGPGNFIVTGDFDGDSQADYLTLLSDQTTFKLFANFPSQNSLNNDVEYFYLFSQKIFTNGSAYKWPELAKSPFLKSIDFNGDGKSEIVDQWEHTEKLFGLPIKIYRGIEVLEISLEKTPYKLQEITAFTFPENATVIDIQFGDFNGDGKSDLLLGSINSKSETEYSVYLSTGREFQFLMTISIPPSALKNNFHKEALISDYNGDGLSDLCFLNIATSITTKKTDYKYYMFYSTGVNFRQEFYSFQNNTWLYSPKERAIVGDFNGDGKSEIIHKTNDVASFFPNSTNHQLEKIVDGYNREVSFTYENATEGNVFGKGAALTFPYNSVQLPMYLASSMTEPDGFGGTSTTHYRYEDAKLYRRGLGFLGFGKVTSENVSKQLSTVNIFGIEEKKFGTTLGISPVLISSSTSKANKLIAESGNETEFQDQGNGRIWLKTNSSYSNNNLTGAYSNTEYEYDNYGNITKQTSYNSGIEDAVMTASYAQHGSWIPSSPVTTTTTVTRQGQAFSKTTKRVFNSFGGVDKLIDFDGNITGAVVTDTKYNTVGLPENITISAKGVKSRTSTTTYDANYRHAIKVVNSLNQVEKEIDYDKRWSKPLSVKDIDGNTTSFTYDGLGRVKTVTPPQGYTVKTFYNWDVNSNSLFIDKRIKKNQNLTFGCLKKALIISVFC